MKVSPILFSRPLSNGLYQVKIRICKNRKSTYITTSIQIEKNKWDNKLRRVKELKSFPQHKQYNEEIEELLSQFKSEDITKRIKTPSSSHQRYDIELFLDFFQRQIGILEAQQKFTSYRKYKVVFNHLSKFSNQSPQYQKIDRVFLDEFNQYLFKSAKIKQNGFYSYFKVFRTFIYKIIDSGDENFKAEYNPFLNYKLKEDPVHKTKLSKEQLDEIIGKRYMPNSALGMARNLFLFSFYSGGMRVADLLTLKWKNIIDGRLEYTMRKTKKKITFPLNIKQIEILQNYLPDISRILDKDSELSTTALDYYKPIPFSNLSELKIDGTPGKIIQKDNELKKNPNFDHLKLLRLKIPNEFIFPPLRGFANETKLALDKMIISKTTIYNKNLKKISLDCELGISLSSHIARHTFSDLLRVSGAGLYEISKILGHSDISITQKYLKTLDQGAVDDAINKFYGMNY